MPGSRTVERQIFSHQSRTGLAMMIALCIATAKAVADDVFVYSTRSDNRVHIVSAASLSPIAEIDAQVGAHELAISPDGKWLIGSAYGGPGQGHQPADKRLAIIDAKSKSVHRIVDLGVERPNDVAFLPGGNEAIVTVEVPPRLIRINAESGEFTQIHLKHQAGHMLALHPSGKTAYVAHVMPGGISVVDLDSGEVNGNIDTPTGAEGIACSPDGKQLWVACNRADAICIIDTASNSITRTIIAKGYPFRVRFSPDGKQVAVSFPAVSEVRFFDATAPDRVVRVNLKSESNGQPVQPTSIAYSPDGKSLAAVCDGKTPELIRIDVSQAKVTHRTPTSPTPDALAAGTI